MQQQLHLRLLTRRQRALLLLLTPLLLQQQKLLLLRWPVLQPRHDVIGAGASGGT